jgi:glycosyltransferase involved in cell wall biosynthesis
MLNNASISIIIPTRNRPEFLREAVASVLHQTCKATEIIIVDDCSDEVHKNDIQNIHKLDSSIQLHLLQEHKGVSFCRNLGLEVAKGEHVIFLDDDDTLNDDMLEKSIEALVGCDVVSCRTHVFIENNKDTLVLESAYNWQKTATFDIYPIEENPAEHIFLYHPMVHSFVFRRAVFEKSRFPEDLSYGEDFYVWLSLANSGLKFKKLDFVGGKCRVHENSLSSSASVSKKLTFYNRILTELNLSREVRNLVFFKMSIIYLKSKKISFLPYLLLALSHPRLFLRHAGHFMNLHK